MTKTTQERKRGLVWPLASKEGVYSGGGGSGWPGWEAEREQLQLQTWNRESEEELEAGWAMGS